MSNLKKIADEDRESKFGYVYAVSGPGKSLKLRNKIGEWFDYNFVPIKQS